MFSGTTSSKAITTLTFRIFFLSQLLLLLLLFSLTSVDGQIYNGGAVIPVPNTGDIVTTDIIPSLVTSSSKSSSSSSSTSIDVSTVTPPAPTTPPPPIPVQPYTTAGPAIQVTVMSPLPLPTTPALFPQNISTCSTCYGQFSTLSRCNAIANSNTFPVTANTTYASLLPFLKCICTYRALDTYPYCIDCFQKTQQLNQLNVLQAYHLENYMDAFHQLCGVTYNGNKVPGSNGAETSRTRAAVWTGLLMVTTAALGFL